MATHFHSLLQLKRYVEKAEWFCSSVDLHRHSALSSECPFPPQVSPTFSPAGPSTLSVFLPLSQPITFPFPPCFASRPYNPGDDAHLCSFLACSSELFAESLSSLEILLSTLASTILPSKFWRDRMVLIQPDALLSDIYELGNRKGREKGWWEKKVRESKNSQSNNSGLRNIDIATNTGKIKYSKPPSDWWTECGGVLKFKKSQKNSGQ